MQEKQSAKQTYDLYFWCLVSFTSFIALLPRLMPVFIPCLGGDNAVSYDYAHCNTLLALDRYILMIVLGLSVIVSITCIYVSRYILKHQKVSLTLLPAILTVALCATIGIASYYLYLPSVARGISRVPIILDSLHK